jgi:hypothetical protein
MKSAPGGVNIHAMRQPEVKRYALARAGILAARPEEGVKRLWLVRMEAIAEADRKREERPGRRSAA